MLNQDPNVRLLLARERMETLRRAARANGCAARPLRMRAGEVLVRAGRWLAEGRIEPARSAG